MGALLALTSAVCYGIVDFTGGLLSRRAHFVAVTLLGQLGGRLLAGAAALLLPADAIRPVDLLWGALSGVGSGAECVGHPAVRTDTSLASGNGRGRECRSAGFTPSASCAISVRWMFAEPSPVR